MYTPPQLYVPSKVIRANPETLSGLLLVVGNELGTGTHFFQFASLDPKRLEEVVETFPDPLRDGGREMVDLQNRAQNGNHPLFNIQGYANTAKLYLNPEIKGADRYDLGIVGNGYTF